MNGSLNPLEPRVSQALLIEMLRRMVRIRLFDEAATRVQWTSIPGLLHNSTGQEAAIVGACLALREDDYITGNHRSHGHPIGKGAPLAPLMAELFGKSTGVCRGKGGSMHLADFSVGSLGESGIVGGLIPAAVGAALSAVLRETDQVCLCFFGDGAANCGPLHESLNLAAIWALPVIFFCENNGYAMYTPQAQATPIADIAARGQSYGMPGQIVDGQDVLAVHRTVARAVSQARASRGPTLIEAKTYRFCEHSEGTMGPPYRSEEEIAAWRRRDPIDLFTTWLFEQYKLEESVVASVRLDVELEVTSALDFASNSPEPVPDSLYEDLFK